MADHHSHQHTTHPAIIKRLNRATGHLKSIVGMIEEGRPCTDIAMQLSAVEKAVANAKRTLIEDHIGHCIGGEADVGGKAMAEFRAISKYL
ncbi:metal-sensing transcriptional repressor [Sphingopyxis sp. R3-92]|uniref:metal-sensing transcriptional repressor n=1 Tax=Sphingopyxis sp. R3-92 TaxID=3158553 RepID=UPI003EE80C2C